ncbi:MAG TPA: hypothetical protein VN457_06140, partial [Chlamydiales bacterium]|nr:hypothetical protein [Chlamydiales bacterium]
GLLTALHIAPTALPFGRCAMARSISKLLPQPHVRISALLIPVLPQRFFSSSQPPGVIALAYTKSGTECAPQKSDAQKAQEKRQAEIKALRATVGKEASKYTGRQILDCLQELVRLCEDGKGPLKHTTNAQGILLACMHELGKNGSAKLLSLPITDRVAIAGSVAFLTLEFNIKDAQERILEPVIASLKKDTWGDYPNLLVEHVATCFAHNPTFCKPLVRHIEGLILNERFLLLPFTPNSVRTLEEMCDYYHETGSSMDDMGGNVATLQQTSLNYFSSAFVAEAPPSNTSHPTGTTLERCHNVGCSHIGPPCR